MDSENLKRIPDDIPRVKQVVVDGEKFTIHCYRWAAMSDYFHVLFTQELFVEKNMKNIELYGIDSNVFSKVHQLLNTGGKHNVNRDDAVKVYTTCRYFLVKNIILEQIRKFILANLEHLDVMDLFDYCATNNDLILLEGVQEFMLENSYHLEVLNLYYYYGMNNDSLLNEVVGYLAARLESIRQAEAFQALPVEALLRLVTDDRVKVDAEDSLCWIIATWLAHNEDRKIFLDEILKKIIRTKFDVSRKLDFPEEWNVTSLADALFYHIFAEDTTARKPFLPHLFAPDEASYISNEDGVLLLTQFDGDSWITLTHPRKPIDNNTRVNTAVRMGPDLIVATTLLSPRESNVMHYNIRSDKMAEMRQPDSGEIKGLHLVDYRVYSNTEQVVQQYCPEYDLWLNPIDIGFHDYRFSATDSQRIVVGGKNDWLGITSIRSYDPRENKWTDMKELPNWYSGTCGTFVENKLYVVAIGNTRRTWRILSLDVRNNEWETISYGTSRSSAIPLNITRCKNTFVVMDSYRYIYTSDIQGVDLDFYSYYKFALKPVYSID